MVVLSQQRAVHRNEGSRKSTLTEQVLKEVWNPEGCPECVGCIRVSEEVGKGPITDQTSDATEKDTAPYQEGWPAVAGQ
jgi:hypothetical protein